MRLFQPDFVVLVALLIADFIQCGFAEIVREGESTPFKQMTWMA